MSKTSIVSDERIAEIFIKNGFKTDSNGQLKPYVYEAAKCLVSEVVNDEEFSTLLICAFRYAFGRMTYITHTVSELLIKLWPEIPVSAKSVIAMGLKAEINRSEMNGDYSNFGHDCDKESWFKLIATIERFKNDG